MYSYGESFYHTIEDERVELSVLENIAMGEKEYLLVEDADGINYVFFYDDNDDNVYIVDDEIEKQDVLDYLSNEFSDSNMNDDNEWDYEEDDYDDYGLNEYEEDDFRDSY